MSYIVICTVACLASGLTFLSGFGLGTLLLPALALFFLVEQAVAAAFAGAVVGKRVLRSVTMEGIRHLVAGLLVIVGLGLVAGLL